MERIKNSKYELYYELEDFCYATLFDSEERFMCNIYEESTIKKLEKFDGTMEQLFDLIGEKFNYYSTDLKRMFVDVMLDDLNNHENVKYLVGVIEDSGTFESELLSNDYINLIKVNGIAHYVFME